MNYVHCLGDAYQTRQVICPCRRSLEAYPFRIGMRWQWGIRSEPRQTSNSGDVFRNGETVREKERVE